MPCCCSCQNVLRCTTVIILSYHRSFLRVSAPGATRRSAIRLGVFAYLLFQLSSGVDGYFEGQALPDQLTARNITITLRTVVRGLSYLLTFLFAANTIGLAGETTLGLKSKPRSLLGIRQDASALTQT